MNDWQSGLTERERKEIAFCKVYASDFAHGTDGHGLRMLIAKLADTLDTATASALASTQAPSDAPFVPDENLAAFLALAEQAYGGLAHRAYHAYGQTTDFKNYQGLPMPEWDALTPRIKLAWCMASKAVVYGHPGD